MRRLYHEVNTMRVLSLFFDDPFSGFYLREMSRILDISPMTVKRKLEILEEDDMIMRYKEKTLTLFKFNLDNSSARYFKISYNLSVIHDLGLVQYLHEIDRRIHSIILFGSYSKGMDGPESDVDLLIISSGRKIWKLPVDQVNGRTISCTVMTPTNWKEQSVNNRAFYIEVIRDGIPLYGEIPVME